MKVRLKTPISYYGGKQKLVSTILPLIPVHRLYAEPFCGGAAVFWAKEPSPVEVINDMNGEVVNFYRVLQRDYEALYTLVDETLHSRLLHQDAAVMYQNPHLFSDVQRAWAFWVQTNMSFAGVICHGWGYGRSGNNTEKKIFNNKERFKEVYKSRLSLVQIEFTDALKVIRSRDCDDAFFYCDPPYPNTEQGHYSGYTMEHFRHLLDVLMNIKGKFMLSSFPNDLLKDYAARFGWKQTEIQQQLSASKEKGKKIEVLTMNY